MNLRKMALIIAAALTFTGTAIYTVVNQVENIPFVNIE